MYKEGKSAAGPKMNIGTQPKKAGHRQGCHGAIIEIVGKMTFGNLKRNAPVAMWNDHSSSTLGFQKKNCHFLRRASIPIQTAKRLRMPFAGSKTMATWNQFQTNLVRYD